MRRIDALLLTLAVFIAGGLLYSLLQTVGLDDQQAGIWAEAVLVVGVVAWLGSYLFRVFTKNMTYFQQVRDYREAVLQKRLESLSPEELAQLQAEIEAERSPQPAPGEASPSDPSSL